MQYSLDQYTLIPKALSNIDSRKEINVLDENGKLPVFVAPMTCILDKKNFDTFLNTAFIPIYPVRCGESIESRLQMSLKKNCWISLSLTDFFNTFLTWYDEMSVDKNGSYKVLIDCADGHLESIYRVVKETKERYPNIKVMVGNIANPETYVECCRAGVDYVRVGIGGGSGCTTSVQTGFHAGMGWLLEEIQKIRTDERFQDACEVFNWTYTKVIADGGINTISKAVKALALGADYVMMGRCFAQCEEACGKVQNSKSGFKREYYGQASEQGQIDRFGRIKGNPEGTSILVPIDCTLESWQKKLEEVFRSALSYGGAHDFSEFIGKVQYDLISNSEFKSFDK